MIAKNLYAYNVRARYGSYSATGGHLIILVGIIFLIVSYFSLSPFSKIRKFFEGGVKRSKKQ